MPLTINAKILVVCHNERQMRSLLDILDTLRYIHVKTASDGREALRLIDSQDTPFQLIISDCNLPSVCGLNLLREIRTTQPSMPFILTCEQATSDVVLNASEYGVSAFLKWPFKKRDLAEKIALINKYGNRYHVPMKRQKKA